MSNFASLYSLLEGSDVSLRKDASSSGGTIFAQLGLNAVNLEQQAKSLVPYNAPFLNSTPRVTSDVGGLTVQWKAVLSASPLITSLSEANRAASASLLEKEYSAPFKTMGVEVDVSMFAQETGRGYQDNIGFAQFSAMQMFLRAQDQMLLCDGNSGTAAAGGQNGFVVGTSPTPVAALVLISSGITAATNVSGYIVALTSFGIRAQQDPSLNPNIIATAAGLTPLLSATNVLGTSIGASGGTAVISAASNIVVTDSTHRNVNFSFVAPFGVIGFALYVDSTDAVTPAKANAFFAGIFPGSSVTIAAVPANTKQAATFAGLTTDYSYDNNQVDSYLAWSVNWSSQGASPVGNYAAYTDAYYDQNNAAISSVGDGSVSEFSTIAQKLYNNYKSAPDRILIAAQTVTGKSLKEQIQAAMVGSGTSNAGRLLFDSKDGVLTGGTRQLAYEWPYSYDGISKVITLEVMPWLPSGTIVFETTANPYPQAAGRIPAAFEVHSLLETFGIMWPIRQLQREYGTYGFLATKSYLPHVSGVIQNIGG